MENSRFVELTKGLHPSLKMKLDSIRKYLHDKKAALMIGAGFSKNADMDESTTVKDWFGLADDFYESIYGVSPEDKDVKYRSVLRLASQVESSKGRNFLESQIQKSLPDDRVYPGRLHIKLMKMPWADVFTTNYDTLLEKAFVEADRFYHKVTNKETLLYAPHPRIVKLHGSFPDIRPFIITEEDFRTYPQKFPEMVNTVRQSLIENVLCLIGFSGDDPNFQSWLGWLRDVMGRQVAPVYQITYNKNMHESNVKLSYDLGVDVVNLAEIQGLNDFTDALDFCFEYIGKPFETEWEPTFSFKDVEYVLKDKTKTSEDVRKNMREAIDKMQKIRLSYPGWYVLPSHYFKCFNDVKVEYPYLSEFVELIDDDDDLLVDLLYEVCWRYGITLSSLDFEWYVKKSESLSMNISECPKVDVIKKKITIKLSLLTLYRGRNEVDKFNELIANLGVLSTYFTYEHERILTYEKCLFFLGRFEYAKIDDLLQNWMPRSFDYKGDLWKAAILAEIGRDRDAVSLLRETLKNIKRNILGSKSSELLLSSRKAIECFLWYVGACEERPKYDDIFNPITLFRIFKDNIVKSEEIREKKTTIHNFGLLSTGTQYSSGENGFIGRFLGSYRYIRLYEELGLPISSSALSGMSEEMVYIVKTLLEYKPEFAFTLLARGGNKIILDKQIDRACLSCVTRLQALGIMKILYPFALGALENETTRYLTDKVMKCIMPLLSNLSVLLPSEDVKKIFYLWIKLYKRYPQSYEKRYVKQLYLCMKDSDVYECRKVALDLPILETIEGADFYFSSENMIEQTVNKDAFIEVIKRLKDPNPMIVEAAYQRTLFLLKCQIDDSSANLLKNAIMQWRNVGFDTFQKKHSIICVPLESNGNNNEESVISSMLSEFLNESFVTQGSSVAINSFTKHLWMLSFFTFKFTEEQHVKYVQKIVSVMTKNEELFKKDDSNAFMGGIRQFIAPVFNYIDKYFLMSTLPAQEDDIWGKYADVLLRYHTYGYATLAPYVHLQLLRGETYTPLKNLIEKNIMSDNKIVAKDACNALVVLSQKKGRFTNQAIVKDIIHYIRYNEDEYASGFYLDSLIRVLLNNGICKGAKSLLLSWFEGFIIHLSSIEQWTASQCDLLFLANKMAGVISVKWPEWDYLNEWNVFMASDRVFNDIRSGFKVGVKLAIGE